MDVRWTSPLISTRSEVGNLNSQFSIPKTFFLLTRFWRRERRTFFDSEAPDDRHESLDERLAIPRPSPGIGELENLALPSRPCGGIFHITDDRAEHRSDDSRLEARNFPSKEPFAVTTHRPPEDRIEVIDGLRTQVRQVAAARTKRGKEILVVHLGVRNLKDHAHGPVQPGVGRVEKPSGSRRRLADKQQLNARRPERLAQSFAFASRSNRHLAMFTHRSLKPA